MDPAEVFALLTAIIFMAIAIGWFALAEYRAQRWQREEQQRELLLALFRMSKRHARHVDALALLVMRVGRIDPSVLAETKRIAEADTEDDRAAEREAVALGEALAAEAARRREHERR
jgi:hypothetical protein